MSDGRIHVKARVVATASQGPDFEGGAVKTAGCVSLLPSLS